MPSKDQQPISKLNRTPTNSSLLVGTTDFSRLSRNQKAVWVKQLWKHARNQSFVMRFSGNSANSMIQRISELTATEKGEKAIIQLVQDLTGQGVTGDYPLEGREEEMRSFDTEITIDQLRNATRNVGRMTTQRNILAYREQSKDKLGYWLGDIVDQLGFLTLSGIPYHFNTNGSLRNPTKASVLGNPPQDNLAIGSFSGTGSNSYGYSDDNGVKLSGTTLSELEFAKRVHLPTPNRCFRWESNKSKTNAFDDGNLISLAQEVGLSIEEKRIAHKDKIEAKDKLCYDALLCMRTELKTQKMRGIRGNYGDEFYHIFVHPKAYLTLKRDPAYKEAVIRAMERGKSNPIFSGATVTIDGMVIHEYSHVFNTLKSSRGMKAGLPIDEAEKGKELSKVDSAHMAYEQAVLAMAKGTKPSTSIQLTSNTNIATVSKSTIKQAQDILKAEEKKLAPLAKKSKEEVAKTGNTNGSAYKAFVDQQDKVDKILDGLNTMKAEMSKLEIAANAAKSKYENLLKHYDQLSNGIDYCRVLFCGSQALGMCTLDGTPLWVEKEFDYDNSLGIASGKIFGFEKPQFPSREFIHDPENWLQDPYGHLEDFGVAVLDVAI